jgi:hypothetical protein
MSTAVYGAQVVGGMQRPHDKGEKAVGFMVSTTTGTRGGEHTPWPLLGLDPREEDGETCLCLCVWVWV